MELGNAAMQAAPFATARVLAVLRDTSDQSPAFEQETQAGARAVCSGEVHEGLAAFIGKRSPNWSGARS